MADREDLDNFIGEFKGRQRNIVFPDTVRNWRYVYVFLWKGSPNPTLVQRIAAWALGLFFLAQGLSTFGMAATKTESWISALISVPWILLAAKIFRNGFRKRSHEITPK